MVSVFLPRIRTEKFMKYFTVSFDGEEKILKIKEEAGEKEGGGGGKKN